jgi:MFS family permease
VAVIVAPTVGPTIGGWITDNFSWHWIFFIKLPIGLVSLALVHWLVDDAWVRLYQTVGLPFLFIPINTVAYDGLPPAKTNQASALMNVARNLGGSIGISLANVALVRAIPSIAAG